ncbi:MAG: hypothetical protein H7Y11_09155 [Armatimonadetes bacterium]|nr:hypothetical protein [Anaerolineae bacterium]
MPPNPNDNATITAAPSQIDFTTLTYSGHVIAEDVSYEDFLTGKYGHRTEWIFGKVIQMSYAELSISVSSNFWNCC